MDTKRGSTQQGGAEALRGALSMARSKYGAKPTEVDGIRFASKGEARRYQDLCLMQRAGAISRLTLQPRFPLVVEGVKVGTYVGDFRYEQDGKVVIEDFKGVRTPVYRLKAKLMRALYAIEIHEVAA